MARTMYDSITPGNIPASASMVAGYVDGRYANITQLRARFPHAVVVEITVFASDDVGTVLDVEKGDATPAQAPGWVVKRRRAGVDPSVYCDYSTWPAVRAAFRAAGVTEPHYFVARYDGDPAIPAGAVAKQYRDVGPYDLSSVAPYWPGVDPVPAPPAKPPAPALSSEDDVPAGQLAPGFGVSPQGSITHPELASLVWLGGKESGAVAGSWLCLYCDFGTARVRVAIRHPGGWDIRHVDLDSTEDAVWVAGLPQGATHASLLRMDRTSDPQQPDTSADVPVGFGVVMQVR